jgi:hypothetical protein
VIDLDPKVLQNNISHHRKFMPDVPFFDNPDMNTLNEGPILVPVGTHLEEFGKGRWYCKVGRTTGFTAGLCNGLTASIQWDSPDRTRYDENGKQVVMREGITRE